MTTQRISPRHKLSTFERPTHTETGLLVLVHRSRDTGEYVAWCPHLELTAHGNSFSKACDELTRLAAATLGHAPDEPFDFQFENFGA